MAGKAPVSVTLNLVDKATAPLRAFSATVKQTFEPFQKAKNAIKLTAAEMGLPKVKSAFTGIGKAAGGVFKEVKKLGKELALLGGLGVGFLGGIAVTTANAGDAAYKTAQKIGVSTEAWTKLAYAADMSGVSSETLKTGMTRLNKQITDAAKGNKQAQYWFNALGISIRDQSGKLKTADAVMAEAADKLAGMENGAKKSRLSMELFGKAAGPDMIPLLNAGKEGIEELGAEAESLAITFSSGQGQASESFCDSLARVKYALLGVSRALGVQLIPVFEPLLLWIKETIAAVRPLLAAKFGDALAPLDKWIKSIVSIDPGDIATELRGLLEDFERRLPDVIAWLEEFWCMLAAFKKGVTGVVEALGGWSEVLPYIGAGLAAIKLAPLIFSIGALAKAFVGLGIAILTTPIGWIMPAIAALAAGVYLIYKHWDGISDWFKKLWVSVSVMLGEAWEGIKSAAAAAWSGVVKAITGAFEGVLGHFEGIFIRIREAFDTGLIAGIAAILYEFHPVTFFAKAFDAVLEYLTGFSLLDTGAGIINSLWDGLKGTWSGVSGWFKDSISSLTDWMPDFLTEKIGLKVDMPELDVPHRKSSMPALGPPAGVQAMARQTQSNEHRVRDARILLESRNLPDSMRVTTQGVDQHTRQENPFAALYGGALGAGL